MVSNTPTQDQRGAACLRWNRKWKYGRVRIVFDLLGRAPACLWFLWNSYGYLQKRPRYRGSNLVSRRKAVWRAKFLSPADFHVKSEKNFVTTNYAHTCWNGLKRVKNMFLRNTNIVDLADFSTVPNLRDIARSSKFDHLWRWRFLSYTLDFWPLSRHTGLLWIPEM